MNKQNKINRLRYICLFVFSILLLTNQACKKDVDPIPSDSFTISGTVINDNTKEPIANAIVYCLGKVTNSNNDGRFYFTWRNSYPINEVLLITSKKVGYTPGKAIFNLGNGSNTNVRMIPTNPPVTIGPGGGEIDLNTDEGLGNTNIIKITFLENAVSSPISVSATLLKGIQIPGFPAYINTGCHNASTIYFEPSGQTFNVNFKIGFVLPVRMDQGVEIPIMKYNEASSLWELTTKKAIVDASGFIANGYLNSFSTYSVGISGDYEESIHSIDGVNKAGPIKDDPVIPDTIFCTEDSIIYPNGIPDSISVEWIFNATANNTTLFGTLVLDEECWYDDWDYVCQNCYCYIIHPLGPRPCPDCVIRYKRFWFRAIVYEYITVRWFWGGVLIDRRLFNELYQWRSKICPYWFCPPDCHQGGSGSKK